MNVQEAYAEGFCKAAEVLGVDPDALVKAAVEARILPPGSPDEPIFHTREALMEARSPRSGYSYGMGPDAVARAFDSHGNVKLTPAAAKELNTTLSQLRDGGSIGLPRALSTPGSHHSAAALRARLPARLERQLYRGEIRDALYKYWRGGKADRLLRLGGSSSPKVSRAALALFSALRK